ncbi:MAG: histidinol-phosphatase HisJ family protein [Bacillota bacterium]
MYDFHVHSCFSNDCSQTLEQISEKAYQIGLEGICLTDHVDIDYESAITFEIDYKEYAKAIEKLRQKYAGKLSIFMGLELGLQPHVLEKCNAYLADKPFDFIIGSIHAVKRKELFHSHFLEGITEHQGILDYFEELLFCVRHYSDYDILGHMDVFRRYLKSGEHVFNFNMYREYIEEVLKTLISNGKGIEINTSGTYGLSTFHPLPEIIMLYKELGGEIITLGSDSHYPQVLGDSFDKAKELLLRTGFKQYTIFKERKPLFIEL